MKRDFLEIYLATFLESLISEMQHLWGSYFVPKYLEFNLDFKNAAKISENFSFFELIASALVSLIYLY